jgi:hypothetical protein
MAILESHRQLVNDAILSLGIDPITCQQSKNQNLWKMHRGQTQIIIVAQESITHKDEKTPTISMMAPILQIPKKYPHKEELCDFILDANHKLIVESFSISNNWIILSSTYYLDEMRRQEVIQLIDGLSFHAQSFSNILAEKFEFPE